MTSCRPRALHDSKGSRVTLSRSLRQIAQSVAALMHAGWSSIGSLSGPQLLDLSNGMLGLAHAQQGSSNMGIGLAQKQQTRSMAAALSQCLTRDSPCGQYH